MTYHDQRRQAEELLRRNYSVSQVAKELGLLVRTVSRWAKLLREPEPEVETHQESESASEIVQVEVIPSPPAHASSTRIQDQEWYKDLEKMNAKHRIAHGRFQKIMLRGLEAFESMTPHEILENARPLQILSLGSTRHIDGESKTRLDGREDLITDEQAFKRLQAKGYSVIDESAIKSMQVVE